MTEIQGNREQRPTRASRTAAPVVSRAQGTMASIEDFLELAWVRPELQTTVFQPDYVEGEFAQDFLDCV